MLNSYLLFEAASAFLEASAAALMSGIIICRCGVSCSSQGVSSYNNTNTYLYCLSSDIRISTISVGGLKQYIMQNDSTMVITSLQHDHSLAAAVDIEPGGQERGGSRCSLGVT